MNRRSFITSLLTGIVAPAFLPGAGRVWKRSGELWQPYRRAFIPFNPANYDTCGLITRAQFDLPTPAELNAIFDRRLMDQAFETFIEETKHIPDHSLYSWLMTKPNQ